MTTVEYWEIVKPFRVVNVAHFMQAAENFGGSFESDLDGRIHCQTRAFETDRLPLGSLYQLIQQHLAPREYAVVRIKVDRSGDEGDDHIRYEKVYLDRIVPAAYSDDPNYRR